MARLPRVTQKIFAGSATNNGVFGSAQAATFTLSNVLATIMGLAAWGQGWLSAVIGGSKFPPLEEFQAVEYVHSSQIAYLLQQGISEYDAGTTYFANNICVNGGTLNLYASAVDNNTGNALTNPAYWNYLGNLSSLGQSVLITASGTWTCPAGVTNVLASGCAGGGSGAGSNGTTNGGGGGGGAQCAYEQSITVVPGTVYTVTIGTGGAAVGTSVAGNNGTATSLGALLTLSPGQGGSSSTGAGFSGGFGGAAGGDPNLLWGGDGGGTIFGPTNPARSTTGVSGSGYGSGGSGGTVSGGVGHGGGAGAPGFLLLEW